MKPVLCAIIALLLLAMPLVYAADEYKPYLHKAAVPEHPKVKMYGSYRTNLFPGAATYSYSIEVPKGTNGLQPSIALSYNSQGMKQRPGIVGAGWSVTENYVYRDTNATLGNTNDDAYTLVLNGNAHRLVYDESDGLYHTNPETYIKLQNYSSYWTATGRDGTQYRFGYNTDARLVSSYGYAAKWHLDFAADTHGNKIYYTYQQNPYSGESGAVYLHSISYNNDQKRAINFTYETRPDKREVYEQGVRVNYTRRLSEINVYANNALVRKYSLRYNSLNTANSIAPIASIAYYGADGASLLHNISFQYYLPEAGFLRNTSYYKPPILFSESAASDRGIRLADLNRDGFVDAVKSRQGDYVEKAVWLNDRNSNWTMASDFTPPVYFMEETNAEYGVRLEDLNKDGYPDLIQGHHGGLLKKAWRNNGTGFVDWPAMYSPEYFFMETSRDAGTILADVNNDGYTDILRSNNDGEGPVNKIYLNNRSNGWYNATNWPIPTMFIQDGVDLGVRVVDVNGDGFADIIEGFNKGVAIQRAWLNNGTGWVAANSTWKPPLYFTTSDHIDAGVRIADINGDGLPDLVEDYANVTTFIRSAWLNTGSGWAQDSAWQSPEPFTSGGNNIGRRITDLNADGFSDIFVSYANGTGTYEYAWVKNSTTSYLLKSITNEYGGVTYLNYTDSTQYNNNGNDSLSDIGFNVNVVKSVTQNNSMTSPFNVLSLSNYTYRGGKYDYSSSEFRGFAVVNETKADNTKAVHYFLQDEALKGKEYMTEIYSADNIIYSKEQNTYRSVLNNSYYKIFLDITSSAEYDSNAKAKEVNVSYEYNTYGDVSRKLYQGDTNVSGDEKWEDYIYFYNTSNWIMGKVRRYLLQDNSTIAKVSWYSYDNGVNTAPQAKGELTRVENWLSGSSNPITSYEYDSYGNLVRETDALGHITKHEYGTRDLTYTYKDRDVNALGYFTDYSTDLGTGNLLWQEENHIRKSYVYDTFGRKVKEVMPYDDVQMPTTAYNYSFDGITPEVIKVSKKAAANSTINTYSYYDGFANLVQQRGSAESGQQTVKDIFYDNMMRASSESIPYFDAFNLSINSVASPTTNYTYDTLGRVIRVTNPDGTNKTISFTSHNVTAFDENSHKKKYLLDSFGRIQNVFEYNNDPVLNDNNEHLYNTTYTYDLNDNLVNIKDTKGNNFIFTFDTLGRKIGMNDPDLGVWAYSYDANGNLVKQSDANGNSINLSYDNLNRLTRKAANTTIFLSYDGQFFGTLSNITFIDTNLGEVIYRYTYDNRYRIINEELKIKNIWRTTGITYDSMDRVIEKRLPNGTLDYFYNKQGLVDKIPSFVNATNYNAFGNPLNRSFTNLKIMQYAYNAQNGRLTGIDTSSIQNLDYSYDSVGNVKQINDVVNNRVQSMTYDYLDRLVNATINNSDYRYVYDETGNILKIVKDFNASTRFGHTSSHVHAPSSVVDGNAGVMVYKIKELNILDKNRTVEFYIVNERNETLTNVNWTIDWGDSSSTGSTIGINLSISQNIMVIAGHTYANAGDFNVSVRASYANNTDTADEKAVKFGIKADSLALLNQNITNTTFEFKVRNDMAENANTINWSCDNGISSTTPFNLTGNQSIFIIISSNYSTPGGKALVCNATSANGNDLKSLSFNIKDVAIEEYNSTAITGSKRLVNLMVKNYFSTQNVGYTFQSDGQVYSGIANIGSGNTSVISQQINYTTPGTKTLIANISTAYTIDNRTEMYVLKGLEISNYLLVNKTLTDKILGYTILNQWDNMSVNWTLTNPSISSGTKVNLSYNETLFVLIEENYTTSSTKDVNFTIFNGTISASFIDRFIVNILDIISNSMLFGSQGLSISEVVIKSNIGTQNVSWRFSTGIENITSVSTLMLNNTAPAFIFIANNYTTSGVYATEAFVNSTLYNATLAGSVIAR